MGIKVNGKVLNTDEIGQKYRQQMNSKSAAEAERAAMQKALAESAASGKSGAGVQDDAEAAAAKKAAEERSAKLAEIMSLPVEERVGALLDAGFNKEAAEWNERLAHAQSWSALITLLNERGIISIADQHTHDMLESASSEELDDKGRIESLRYNELGVVADYYQRILDGESVEDIAAGLTPDAGTGDAPGTGEEGAGTDAGETAGEGTAEAPAEGAGEQGAAEAEKKKAGRPKKSDA